MVLRELIVKLGLLVKDGDFKKADDKIDKVKKAALGLATAVGSFAALRGLTNLVDSVSTAGDQIAKTAQRMGVGVEALQELHFAGDLANVSAEQLDNGLKFLSKNMAQAADKGGEIAQVFRELGVPLRDANGQLRPVDEALLDVADGISRIGPQADRVRKSIQLFGRDGASLLTLLQDGKGTIAEARAEFRALGGGFTEAEARRMEEYRDNLTRMNVAFMRIKISIVSAVMPAFEFVVGGIIKVTKQINKFLEGTRFLEAAFGVLGAIALALGVKFLIAFAVPIAMIAAWIVAFGVVTLVVEEFFALFDDNVNSLGKKWSAFLDQFTNEDRIKAGEGFWMTSLRTMLEIIFDIQGALETAWNFWAEKFPSVAKFLGSSQAEKFAMGQEAGTKIREGAGRIGDFWSNFGQPAEMSSRDISPVGGGAVVNQPQFNMELSVQSGDAQGATDIADHLMDRIDERLQVHLDNAFAGTVR